MPIYLPKTFPKTPPQKTIDKNSRTSEEIKRTNQTSFQITNKNTTRPTHYQKY